MHVMVFGNGLSVAPTDGRLTLGELTPIVWQWLHEQGLQEDVRAIVRWSRPDQPELDIEDAEGNFEAIAGALDRLARAVREIVPLVEAGLGVADTLEQASRDLRRLYVRVVGAALLAVDDAVSPRQPNLVHPYTGADRLDMREMGAALWELFTRDALAIYTLNYDSLLMEALLYNREGRQVYDGMPNLQLADSFEPWTNQLPLYPLHGTLGTYQAPDGSVRKVPMDDVRDRRLLEGWRDGDFGPGLPAVVLGDAKRHSIRQEPFASYYEALGVDLERASTVIVSGYGFGDVPLNSRLALYLSRDASRSIQDWRPTASQQVDDVLASLRRALPAGAGAGLADGQVVPVDVGLPSADAVERL